MSGTPPDPGFVSGTSAEFLGRRPLRKILLQRQVVLVLGPPGCGKTSVARRVGEQGGQGVVYLSTSQLEAAMEVAVRRGGEWPDGVGACDSLVLDGPCLLKTRRAACELLLRLIQERSAAGLRTVVCENNPDDSAIQLQRGIAPGRLVTVALRFPKSRSGRMRVARRIAEEMGLPKSAAKGTDGIEPWRYDKVIDALGRGRLEG